MAIFRVIHKENFTVISNHIQKEKKLSWAAKGIYLYAFSNADRWRFSLKSLINQSPQGKTAVLSALKELQDHGYLELVKCRNEKGQFLKNEWVFYERPKSIYETLPSEEKQTKVSDNQELDKSKKTQKNENSSQEKNPSTHTFEPRSENPAADYPAADNQPLTNTTYETNTKEQQTPVAVVYFEKLENVNIPIKEKDWLLRSYDRKTIEYAIEFATSPHTKIKTSLLQTIKWAAKEKPEMPFLTASKQESNKTKALFYESSAKIPKGAFLLACSTYVEIGSAGNHAPTIIKYDDKAFDAKLEEAAKKYRVTIGH